MTAPADKETGGPEFKRAEEMLDALTQTAESYASQVSLWILKGLARGREEAEDICAEAQSLGRTERS